MYDIYNNNIYIWKVAGGELGCVWRMELSANGAKHT